MKMVIVTNDVLQYFYVSLVLVVPVFCGLEKTCTPSVKNQGRRGTCGSQLTQLISVACMFRGGYNTNNFKRSAERMNIPDQIEKELPALHPSVSSNTASNAFSAFKDHFKQQLVSKRQAMSFLVKKSAYDEQGIVCECCYHQCSFGEITDYCRGDGFDYFKRSSPPEKRRYVDKIMSNYHPKAIHEKSIAALNDSKDKTNVFNKIEADIH